MYSTTSDSIFIRFRPLVILIILIFVSLAAFFMVLYFSGRGQIHQTSDRSSRPLYLRWKYNPQEFTNYLNWLKEQKALITEQRFLEGDFVWALVNGVCMIIGLSYAWNSLKIRCVRAWFVTPVVITTLLDWIENLLQLYQIRLFVQNGSLSVRWIIQLASIVTTTKLVFFYLLLLLTIILLILAAVRPNVVRESTNELTS